MGTTISRLYETSEIAEGVAASLREHEYRDSEIDVISDAAGAAHALTGAGVPAGDAATYAGFIEKGNAVVVCRAPYGRGILAMRLVDEAPTIDAGIKDNNVHVGVEADQFSNILKDHPLILSGGAFPALTRNGTPLSSSFGLKLLSRRKRKKSVIPGGRIMMPFATLSNWRMHTPMLRHNTKPLSNALGWKTLSRTAHQKKVITDNPTPLSTWLCWPTISHR